LEYLGELAVNGNT